jgi:hypothetical protein
MNQSHKAYSTCININNQNTCIYFLGVIHVFLIKIHVYTFFRVIHVFLIKEDESLLTETGLELGVISIPTVGIMHNQCR